MKINSYWFNGFIILLCGYVISKGTICFITSQYIYSMAFTICICYLFAVLWIKSCCLYKDSIVITYPCRFILRKKQIKYHEISKVVYHHGIGSSTNSLLIFYKQASKTKCICMFSPDTKPKQIKEILQFLSVKKVSVKIRGSQSTKEYFT